MSHNDRPIMAVLGRQPLTDTADKESDKVTEAVPQSPDSVEVRDAGCYTVLCRPRDGRVSFSTVLLNRKSKFRAASGAKAYKVALHRHIPVIRLLPLVYSVSLHSFDDQGLPVSHS